MINNCVLITLKYKTQRTYCLVFKKNTENKNAKVFKTKNGRL